MVGASKILTVSYGTFSCTLEGFDDAFGTMKAIAEYFRDLASEDRYFGAVPPTPDAEMLQRIAEREIQRRVETRLQANGVHLRASEGAIAASFPAAAAVSPSPHLLVDPVVPAQGPAGEPEDEGEIVAVSHTVSAAPTPNESVAAKLARIRAMVARNRAEPVPVGVAAAASDIILPEEIDTEEVLAEEIHAGTAEPEVASDLDTEYAASADLAEDAADKADAPVAEVLAADDLPEIEAVEAPVWHDVVGETAEPDAEPMVEAVYEDTTAEVVEDDHEVVVASSLEGAADEDVDDEVTADEGTGYGGTDEDAAGTEPDLVADFAEPLADGFDDDVAYEAAPDALLAGAAFHVQLGPDEVVESGTELLHSEPGAEETLADDIDTGSVEAAELLYAVEGPDAADAASEGGNSWQEGTVAGDDASTVADMEDKPAEESALILAALADAQLDDYVSAVSDDDVTEAVYAEALNGHGSLHGTVDVLVLDAMTQTEAADEPESAEPDIDAAIFEALGADMARSEIVIEPETVDLDAEAALAAALDLEGTAAEQKWEGELASAPVEAPEDEGAFHTLDEATDHAETEPSQAADEDDGIAAAFAGESAAEDTGDVSIADRARSRVLLVKRADFATDPSAAIAAALDVGERFAATPDVRASTDGELAAMLADAELAPEDEAQLMEALAELDHVLSEPTSAEGASDEPVLLAEDLAAFADDASGGEPEAEQSVSMDASFEDGTHRNRDGRTREDGANAPPEDEISRLVETANSRLEGAENKRRMSAIAHLKAAVAATVADRKLSFRRGGEEPGADSELDRYRDDLSRVVQPRRASSQGTDRRPETPAPRPAPLVLVSEQRIDASPQPRPSEPPAVLPRRISASAVAVEPMDEDDEEAAFVAPMSAEEAGSFAEFAESAGAKELPDLLEAAAAYIAIHEGLTHFSRPQVMRKVAAVSSDEFTREQGLQSFGKLLRQGRIQKVRRGQFTISKTSRFTPQSRGAAR